MAYQQILLGIDFNRDTEAFCQRTSELAGRCQAKLTLLHVVEPVVFDTAYDVLPALPIGFESEMEARAQKELVRLGDRFGVPPERCRVERGPTKTTLLRVAEELGVDLIVVGAHGRHGVARLLGSTASSILHSAPCDVLALRAD